MFRQLPHKFNLGDEVDVKQPRARVIGISHAMQDPANPSNYVTRYDLLLLNSGQVAQGVDEDDLIPASAGLVMPGNDLDLPARGNIEFAVALGGVEQTITDLQKAEAFERAVTG